MLSTAFVLTAAGFLVAKASAATCTKNLVIENFSNFKNKTNALGLRMGDDGTMGDWDADEGILYFEPQPNVDSYFYENTGCLATGADGYDALTFRLKGARSGSYHVEVQAQDSCDATAPVNIAYAPTNATTSSNQNIVIPLAGISLSASTALSSVVFYSFTNQTYTWEISNIQLRCNPAGVVKPSSSSVAPPAPPSSSAIPPTPPSSTVAPGPSTRTVTVFVPPTDDPEPSIQPTRSASRFRS